jgi:hypothetical protein
MASFQVDILECGTHGRDRSLRLLSGGLHLLPHGIGMASVIALLLATCNCKRNGLDYVM